MDENTAKALAQAQLRVREAEHAARPVDRSGSFGQGTGSETAGLGRPGPTSTRDRPLNKTMLGVTQPSAAASPPSAAGASNDAARRASPGARSVDLNRTMLGVASPLLSSLQPVAAKPPVPGPEPAAKAGPVEAARLPNVPISRHDLERDETPAAGTPFGPGQPRLGSATQLSGPAGSPPSAAGANRPAGRRLDSRTMLGLRVPEVRSGMQDSDAAATEWSSDLRSGQAAPEPESGQAHVGSSSFPPRDLANQRLDAGTLLGMQRIAQSSGPAAEGGEGGRPLAFGAGAPAGLGAHSVKHGRTMLGVPLPGLSSLPPGPMPSEPPPAEPVSASVPPLDPSSLRPSFEPRPPARSRVSLVLAALVLVALIAMFYVRVGSRHVGLEVSAQIVTTEGGETLLFDVPRAPAGSRLRFGGQEQALAQGKASFALAADSLRVGDNIVLADVVAPNGETTSTRITLVVSYRIAVDTAGLRAETPSLAVVVNAVPGTSVTLDGQTLALDPQGRGSRAFPIDVVQETKVGVIDHVVPYRIQPPTGATVVDQLHTQIPVATLQIDRPGHDVITDRDAIEIAGAVGRDAQVAIDGAAVPVKEQRFQARFPLPKSGEYAPRIVASAAGKAPFGITLNIKRVRDLQQAAKEFVPTPGLNYAKIAAKPEAYRGQPVALDGRVYAADFHAGSSVIQMLVRPCPSTQRCSVWVVDPQAGEVAVDRWVRVLGTVDGVQQFRSEKNEIVSVPKVVARFVLPMHP